MHSTIRPFWPPLTAGIALGLVLLATFLLTGHGLGASGFFARFTAWLGGEMVPAATETNAYLGPFLKGAASPLANWITWEIVGVLLGGLLAALTSGRFRVKIDGAKNLGGGGRIALALGGGVGFAGRAFGATCDNILSVRIVTADGRTLTADPVTNPDLYWACRGGGGGNFGVVTALQLATHPAGSAAYGFCDFPWSQAGAAVAAPPSPCGGSSGANFPVPATVLIEPSAARRNTL